LLQRQVGASGLDVVLGFDLANFTRQSRFAFKNYSRPFAPILAHTTEALMKAGSHLFELTFSIFFYFFYNII
jgi:hypothetical protein